MENNQKVEKLKEIFERKIEKLNSDIQSLNDEHIRLSTRNRDKRIYVSEWEQNRAKMGSIEREIAQKQPYLKTYRTVIEIINNVLMMYGYDHHILSENPTGLPVGVVSEAVMNALVGTPTVLKSEAADEVEKALRYYKNKRDIIEAVKRYMNEEASVSELEGFLGYVITADVIEEKEENINKALAQMSEFEIENFYNKYISEKKVKNTEEKMKDIKQYLEDEEDTIREEIENVLNNMCFGKSDREWSDDMVDKLYPIIQDIIETDLSGQDEDIGRLNVTEEMVVTAMMEYISEG